MKKPFYRSFEKPAVIGDPQIVLSISLFTELITAVKNLGSKHEILLLGTVVYDETENKYTIESFLPPPQTQNSAAYVTTDDDTYPEWVSGLPRETRQKIRLHLHTHPGGTSPSSTDDATLKASLDDLDDFYIRIITNQALQFKIDLFEISKYQMYENYFLIAEDENIRLKASDTGITVLSYHERKSLLTELESKIVKKTYTPVRTNTTPMWQSGYEWDAEEGRYVPKDTPNYYKSHIQGDANTVRAGHTTTQKTTTTTTTTKLMPSLDWLKSLIEPNNKRIIRTLAEAETFYDLNVVLDILKQHVDVLKDGVKPVLITSMLGYLHIRYIPIKDILENVEKLLSEYEDNDYPAWSSGLCWDSTFSLLSKEAAAIKENAPKVLRVGGEEKLKIDLVTHVAKIKSGNTLIRTLELKYDLEDLINTLKLFKVIDRNGISHALLNSTEDYLSLREKSTELIRSANITTMVVV
jgi:hypothetical protein